MPEPVTCRGCEIAWGVIGIAAAAVIGLLAIDLLTGGWIVSLVTGPPAPASQEEGTEDDDAAA